jgi:hypothetical protein
MPVLCAWLHTLHLERQCIPMGGNSFARFGTCMMLMIICSSALRAKLCGCSPSLLCIAVYTSPECTKNAPVVPLATNPADDASCQVPPGWGT